MRAVASGLFAGVLAAAPLAARAQPAADREPGRVGPLGTRPDPGAAPAASAGASAPDQARLGRHPGPWLLVGGSLALVTVGGVLAYSSNAAERDVQDLYVGLNGVPPAYNATTRKLYDDALAEGRRYETLSIVSFGLAGALAAGAAIWFVVDRRGETASHDRRETVTVAPAVAPGAAGASATIRF